MTQQISIRNFMPEDMERVMTLLQGVSMFIPSNANLEQIANDFLGNESSYACVAVCDKTLIGFGSVFMLDRIRGGRAAVIEDVVVDDRARRQGVGRLIVGHLLRYAQTNNCFKVALVTGAHNIKFYESLGFQEDNRSMKLML